MRTTNWTCIAVLLFAGSWGSGIEAASISVSGTYTCSTNAECVRKCRERGGRWRRDTSGATLGTCTIPSSVAIGERLEMLQGEVQRAQRQQRLSEAKRIDAWPTSVARGAAISAQTLRPSECSGLGGTLGFNPTCETNVLCSAETVDRRTSEAQARFQCITDLDGGR